MALHRLVKGGMVTLQPGPVPSASRVALDGICAVLITAAAPLRALPHPSMPPSKVCRRGAWRYRCVVKTSHRHQPPTAGSKRRYAHAIDPHAAHVVPIIST